MQEYNKTDQQLHQLAQLLAKAGRSFVPQREDDSHTNLYFDPMGQRLVTHSFGEPARRLAFNLTHQTFEWVTPQGQERTVASLTGQSINELEETLAKAMTAADLSAEDYLSPLHFDIPNYTDLPAMLEPLDSEGLDEWCYYRRLANQVGSALLGYLNTAGQVRIWPHHFDSGAYSKINDTLGLGYGLAMNDEMVGAPYFYLSGYPKGSTTIDYSQARQLAKGQWKVTEGWKGAVLPLTDLPPRHAMRVITAFVKEATDWYLQYD